MSLSFQQILAIYNEIKSLLVGSSFLFCNNSEERKLILGLKHSERFYRLLLCFQEPFLRFHLLSHGIEKEGAKSYFIKKVNQSLEKSNLIKIELINEDRILMLTFQKEIKQYHLIGEFIPKKPNCYLLDQDFRIIHSLNQVAEEVYQIPKTKPLLSNRAINHTNSEEIERLYLAKEAEASFLKEKSRLTKVLHAQMKKTNNLKEKYTQELERCQSWQKVQHEAKLLQSNIYNLKKGMQKVKVSDWENEGAFIEIFLDPQIEPKDEISKKFLKSKKLKSSLEHVQRNLDKTKSSLEVISQLISQLALIDSLDALQKFSKEHHLEEKKSSNVQRTELPFREYCTAAGLKIWAGKSANDNEKLTFNFAHGSDWWLHIMHYPGSHVILRSKKNQEPDEESLQDAIQVAMHYSKAKEKGEAEICISQRKFVSRFGKGKAGQVHVSKHRVVYAKIDPERFKRLKDRETNLLL